MNVLFSPRTSKPVCTASQRRVCSSVVTEVVCPQKPQKLALASNSDWQYLQILIANPSHRIKPPLRAIAGLDQVTGAVHTCKLPSASTETIRPEGDQATDRTGPVCAR